MNPRTYGQNCGIARALDILGDRWTLLILRDLGMGPRRYKDLVEGLPGIGTNLLASRLKSLEEAGLIERTALPPPTPVAAYALTAIGEELRPALAQFGAWGFRHGAPFDPADMTRAEWLVQGLVARAEPGAVDRFGGVVQINVGGESVWFGPSSADGVRLRPGAAPTLPKITLSSDIATLAALVADELEVSDAIESGALTVAGDAAELQVFLDAFSLTG
ncbi:winged helix-turn-helix transcriptional regulator [Nocardia neocaledoniensis]|uniref:winged helix-turn-helix transcriptional regulator n=1 Tax=Nocardia neocaledoniensis TaxID=236511 RepID=UPI002458DFC2|nr:helix-turn-helix domain-containing protein [Nocardia neocaledoniensis]